MSKPVVTRFAPSPTGYLHIGSARTALFNWLFARHMGGTFRLRIEDTDRQRSTQEAVDAIFESLQWLDLQWDGDVVYQFSRAHRHAAVAQELLAAGHAYHCYCSPEELAAMREEAMQAKRPPRYDGRWRDPTPGMVAPSGVKPVIRLKAPREGTTVLNDRVQGTVTLNNQELDDMVLLRADGTPTYMLSVVVDDHDMDVTHVIRGDDHLTNTFRQMQIYHAMGWETPEFAHIPLIHGQDGSKLSKRHGAVGTDAYRELGFLPEAFCNYLLRLGWAHGDDEIISRAQAIEWFTLEGIGRGPSRLDMAKATHVNAHYVRHADVASLVARIQPQLEARLGQSLTGHHIATLTRGMPGLQERARTLIELAENAFFYVAARPLVLSEDARSVFGKTPRAAIEALLPHLASAEAWNEDTLEAVIRRHVETFRNPGSEGEASLKLGQLAQPLRVALTGTTASPSLFEVMTLLGRDECLGRIEDALASVP